MLGGSSGSVALVHTSTCSFDQLSMLSDLTLEICVPNLRWMAAQRIHRKTPRLHEAQAVKQCQLFIHVVPMRDAIVPGLRAWQSAQMLFPGTF